MTSPSLRRPVLVAVVFAAACSGGKERPAPGPDAGGSGGAAAGAGGSGGGAGTVGGGGRADAGTTGAGGSADAGTTGAGGSADAGTTGAGGTAGSAGSGPGGTAGSAGAPLTIMAIGDSMTASTCWRAALWQILDAKHAGRFDFVGSHTSDFACMPAGYDQDSEAYDNAKPGDFTAAFMAIKPDVALIQSGTDDVLKGAATTAVIDGYSDLVRALRAANPDVKIFLARPNAVRVAGCAACNTTLQSINDQLSSWWRAANVTLVDARNDIDVDADTRDGVHPNDSGSAKIAARWDEALEKLPQFVFPR